MITTNSASETSCMKLKSKYSSSILKFKLNTKFHNNKGLASHFKFETGPLMTDTHN